MCLHTKSIKIPPSVKNREKYAIKTLQKTAKRNITVYKILSKVYYWTIGKYSKDQYKSPYIGFKYERNTLHYQTGKNKFDFDLWRQGNGLYSLVISKGLHAYRNKKEAKKDVFINRKVFKMIIPKGSKYFLGTGGEIVSDKLLWI